MKILLVSEYFPTGKNLIFSGGVEARTYYVAKNLAKKHKVFVITSRLKNTKKHERINNINVYRVGPVRDYQANAHILSIFSLIKFTMEAVRLGSMLNPNIVDGGNFICHSIAKQIAQKNKIPAVFWYPDVYIGQWINTSGIISGISGWLLEKYNLKSKPNHVISISNQTTNKLIKNGISKKLITNIPCGVDSSEFKTKTKKDIPRSILCISRLVGYKNVSDLIWAFALIRKKGLDINLKVVGTGPDEKKLKDQITMLGLKKHTKFYKNIPRKYLIKQISSSHIYCSTSGVEGFGISVIEAAAASIPSVLSGLDVYREITNNGEGVLFFKLKNITDLASSLEKLFVESKLYRQKQREAERLVKLYTWSDITKETENIYQNLL